MKNNTTLENLKEFINNTYRVKYKFLNIQSKDTFTNSILCSIYTIPKDEVSAFIKEKIREHQIGNVHIIEDSIELIELSEEEKNKYYEYYSKLT